MAKRGVGSKYLRENLQVVREAFLRELADGWSVNMAISRAGMTEWTFRRRFSGDDVVRSAVQAYKKRPKRWP